MGCDEPARVLVVSTPDEAIHIELTWHNPLDPDESDNTGSDVDLHLVKVGFNWFDDVFDTYYANQTPDWQPELPSLDIDDTDGAGPEALSEVIEKLKKEDHHFHMEGGSWTSNISWVRGYEHMLGPMQSASALFAEKVLSQGVSPSDPRYRNALFHLMVSQTSCFRYWGGGTWTDYGR